MEIVQTPAAPAPAGHYAQAIVHGGLVYVSGQLPVAPAPGGALDPTAPFDAQARQVLANVRAVLEASASSLGQVLKTTVYVADIAHWAAFDALYAETFGTHRPARTVVPVPTLHHGFLVEMDVIATL